MVLIEKRQIIPRNQLQYSQTKIFPPTLKEGGDAHFYNILRKQNEFICFFFQNVGGIPTTHIPLHNGLNAVIAFNVIYNSKISLSHVRAFRWP